MEEQVVSSVEPKEMNWFARIYNVIFEPRKVFESLKRKPKWLVAFVVISLLGVSTGYFVHPIAMSDQMKKIEAGDKYTDAQKEAMKQGIERVSSGPARLTVLLAPIGIILLFLFVAGVLFLVFNVIMGGDSEFKRVLSVVSHSYVIGIPASIVQLPLIFIKGTTEVHTSLALFLSVDLKDSFIYKFLDGFDVFTLWQVLVLSLGLSIMYNFSFKKSFIPVLFMWVVLILVTVSLSGLGIFGGF